MSRIVLLLGRTGPALDDVGSRLAVGNVKFRTSTNLDEVKNAFAREPIDMVIIGAGLGLEMRLEIVRHVFEVSGSTTVHMKDWDSGPQGLLPFVSGVVRGAG